MLRGGGAKKYNIDYFGYAVNLEFKFKLNFDAIRSNKEKKVKIQKKNRVLSYFDFAIIYKEKLI